MKKKIIITEKQMGLIVNLVKENNLHNRLLEMILEDLNLNYEPAMGVHEMGNQFYNTPMIGKKVNGDTITPKELYEYLKEKYGASREFTQQIIVDWFHGRLKKGGTLSKNVSFR